MKEQIWLPRILFGFITGIPVHCVVGISLADLHYVTRIPLCYSSILCVTRIPLCYWNSDTVHYIAKSLKFIVWISSSTIYIYWCLWPNKLWSNGPFFRSTTCWTQVLCIHCVVHVQILLSSKPSGFLVWFRIIDNCILFKGWKFLQKYYGHN